MPDQHPLPSARRLLLSASVAALAASTLPGWAQPAAGVAPAAAPATALAVSPAGASVDDAYVSSAGTTVRFASPAAGRAVLEADDAWMLATGGFQRRSLMGSATPVTASAFRQWNGDAVHAWAPAQMQRWRAALHVVMPAFAELHVPLPADVLLVASNGQESASAPYTRGNAVVLPDNADLPTYSDALLLAHELWHVAARHAPALATRLYAEIGFQPLPELMFPPVWDDLRIANPDAPDNRHAMALVLDGRNVNVTPVLVAARTELKPGESFFNVLDVRLLEVTTAPGATRSQAVLGADGQPRWHPLNPTYLQRLGGNTGYVIHPEETMADNIALLTVQTARALGGLPAAASPPAVPAAAGAASGAESGAASGAAATGAAERPVRNQALLTRLRAVLLGEVSR